MTCGIGSPTTLWNCYHNITCKQTSLVLYPSKRYTGTTGRSYTEINTSLGTKDENHSEIQ